MWNELLWVFYLLFNFLAILLVYRYFGKVGMYIWVAISTIICNIQVIKTVQLFGLVATLGNIVYGTNFLATDILSENYGKKYAQKAVCFGFVSLLIMTVSMQIALTFTPDVSDFSQSSLETIFSLMPRVATGSLLAYIVSQTHDVYAYEFWRKLFPGKKHIWIRNNGSTMVSQLIDTTIFTFIAFWGVYPPSVFLSIYGTTYIFKWVVAAADTPFVYIASWLKEKGRVRETEN